MGWARILLGPIAAACLPTPPVAMDYNETLLAKGACVQTFLRTFVVGVVVAVGAPVVAFAAAPAGEITNWNQMLFPAALVGGTSPLVTTRVAAIVQVAGFDAVNGIDRRYTPVHVPPAALPGASRDAAAVATAAVNPPPLFPP